MAISQEWQKIKDKRTLEVKRLCQEISRLSEAIQTAIDYLDHMEPDAAEVILLNTRAGREHTKPAGDKENAPT